MRVLRRTVALVAVTLCLLAAGCGRKHGAAGHASESAAAAPAPPTPDTTPVAVLRTPAGLVLKTEQPPPATPSPVPSPGKPAS